MTSLNAIAPEGTATTAFVAVDPDIDADTRHVRCLVWSVSGP